MLVHVERFDQPHGMAGVVRYKTRFVAWRMDMDEQRIYIFDRGLSELETAVLIRKLVNRLTLDGYLSVV